MPKEWREDPLLQGRFNPEFPDDLQVLIHDGSPRLSSRTPELMWVRVTACTPGERGLIYSGTLLNKPAGLVSVKQGETVLFRALKGIEHPILVTEKYLQERSHWEIAPCAKCGLAELWDAPSDLVRTIFPSVPCDSVMQAFSSFCPLCGGVQMLTLKGAGLHEPKCGRCGRKILGAAPKCVYCGWIKDRSLQEVADAGKVQKDTFRSGATLWPFLASAVIFTSLAGLIAWKGWNGDSPDHDELVAIWFAIGTLLFLGPVLCGVQILRRKLIWVHLDPEKGIELPKAGLVPWTRIASIERYAGAFAYKDTFEQLSGQIPQGVAAYRFGCLLIPALLIYFVFLPVIAVLSPWHDRVTITLENGDRIILRDLEDSDRFTRMVRYKIE